MEGGVALRRTVEHDKIWVLVSLDGDTTTFCSAGKGKKKGAQISGRALAGPCTTRYPACPSPSTAWIVFLPYYSFAEETWELGNLRRGVLS
jgi:hypothetical protein